MIPDLRPYPAMKDSGVPWLGQVPEHWITLPLKRWVRMNGEVLPEATDPDYVFRYLDIGSVGTGFLTQKPLLLRFGSAPSRARRIVRDSDTIVSTVRTYLKAIYFVDGDAEELVCSTGFAVLTPLGRTMPKFVSYIAQSSPFTNRITADSVGIAYPAIAESRLSSFHVPVPPIPEQTAIVRFLDHYDRKIRGYIRAKKKLIQLLEEQKQAVIHEAVTGRIDVRTGRPYPAYKPSGVEWLGDAPEHWEVKKLHQVTDPKRPIMYGIVLPGPDVDKGVFIVKGSNCEPGKLRSDLLAKTTFDIEARYGRSRLRENDIVFAIRGGVGASEIVPPELAGANLTQDAARIAAHRGVDPNWLVFAVRDPIFQAC